MADDPKDPPADPAKDDPGDDDPKDLGEPGKKALDTERKRARAEKKRADELETRLNELENKDKSELERIRDENIDLKKQLGDANAKALRLEIAAEKGVKARWLNGTTREELESAADEYLEDHPPAEGAKPPPSRQPKPDLGGGGDPTSEPIETDPTKLAASVPRL